MFTNINLTNIILSVISIIVASLFTLFMKKLFKNYRRPNGKKYGFVSLHATIAFSIVTIIAFTTRDIFLTSLTVILAYLIGRGRLDERQHYLYQVILGSMVGILFPTGIFYLYNKKINTSESDSINIREEYDDKPDNASDDRDEADLAPELKLEDLE